MAFMKDAEKFMEKGPSLNLTHNYNFFIILPEMESIYQERSNKPLMAHSRKFTLGSAKYPPLFHLQFSNSQE